MYFLCSELVEWNVILQVQHMSNNKYNIYLTVNDKHTHNETTACIEYHNVKVMRTRFLMWSEKHIDM
jgi:cephalosporin hydroxylase